MTNQTPLHGVLDTWWLAYWKSMWPSCDSVEPDAVFFFFLCCHCVDVVLLHASPLQFSEAIFSFWPYFRELAALASWCFATYFCCFGYWLLVSIIVWQNPVDLFRKCRLPWVMYYFANFVLLTNLSLEKVSRRAPQRFGKVSLCAFFAVVVSWVAVGTSELATILHTRV